MSDQVSGRYYAMSSLDSFFQVFRGLWQGRAFKQLTPTAKIVLLEFTNKWARWTSGDKRKLKYSKGIPFTPRHVRHLGVSIRAFRYATSQLREAGFITVRSNRPYSNAWHPSHGWKRPHDGIGKKEAD